MLRTTRQILQDARVHRVRRRAPPRLRPAGAGDFPSATAHPSRTVDKCNIDDSGIPRYRLPRNDLIELLHVLHVLIDLLVPLVLR